MVFISQEKLLSTGFNHPGREVKCSDKKDGAVEAMSMAPNIAEP
jgi:hypothetical protein